MDPIKRQLAAAMKAAETAARLINAQKKDQKLLGAGGDTAAADQKIMASVQAAREAEAQRLLRLANQSAVNRAAEVAAKLFPKPGGGAGGGAGGGGIGVGPGIGTHSMTSSGVGVVTTGVSADGEARRAFFSEVEINDYPQKARWTVTHKGALDAIIELTDCSVTTKGDYVPPGRNPAPGKRKLHLLVEGRSEIEVQRCKAEIIRMLEDAAADSRPETGRYAKYSVV
jgi:ATP-dependent RNA helicase DDX46/PRP5